MTQKCPNCGKSMKLRRSMHGRLWGCSDYPACRGIIPANASGDPVGRPADAATRALRVKAMNAFLVYLNRMGFSREDGYLWLQSMLSMTPDECHFRNFDSVACEAVIGLCGQGREV